MKRFLLLIVALAITPAWAVAASLDLPIWRPGTGQSLPAYRADQLSLQLEPSAARAARARAVKGSARALGVSAIDQTLAALGARIRPEFRGETPPAEGSNATDFTAFYLVDLPPGTELSAALDQFGSLAEVAHASPIGLASVTAIPNDSLWAGSWHLYQPSRLDVHAPEAWDLTRGDSAIVVAIIDTGVIPYHPDLGGVTPGSRGQIWTNRSESVGIPGFDDDGNGFIDDVQGWDFVDRPRGTIDISPGEDWRDEDNDPNDFIGHGTSVAGIVGAITDNGIGISGIAWNVRLMPLRVGWSAPEAQTGLVDMSYIAQAIRYATRNGARVINISLSTTVLPELNAAVSAALSSGVSVVIASGNNGSPNGVTDFPALIQVTATDRNDVIPPWANVGPYVDFAAPGAAIPATNLRRTGTDSLGLRQPGYVADANGTSYAAPIASGAVALLQAARLQLGLPPLDPEMVRAVLMSSCDDISTANWYVPLGHLGAGRLNIARALAIVTVPSLPPNRVTDLQVLATTDNQAILRWTASGEDAGLGRASAYEISASDAPLTARNLVLAPYRTMVNATKAAGSPETTVVHDLPRRSRLWIGIRAQDQLGIWSLLSNVVEARTAVPPDPVVDLQVVAAADDQVLLKWSASGEDGAVGRSTAYEILASDKRLTPANFEKAQYRFMIAATKDAGAPESTVVRSLPRWMHLWIGIRARDRFGQWSPLSNVVEAQTASGAIDPGVFSLELASNPCRAPIRFRWSTGDAGTHGRLTLHDVSGRRVRDLSLGSGSFGFVVWDGVDVEGRRVPAGLYFAVLSTPARRTVTRVVVLP